MANPVWRPFVYREFYDVPRAVLLEWNGSLYLLESVFEHERDEYSGSYAVYRFDGHSRVEFEARRDWNSLAQLGTRIGAIAVGAVRFDETRRGTVDAAFLKEMI